VLSNPIKIISFWKLTVMLFFIWAVRIIYKIVFFNIMLAPAKCWKINVSLK